MSDNIKAIKLLDEAFNLLTDWFLEHGGDNERGGLWEDIDNDIDNARTLIAEARESL